MNLQAITVANSIGVIMMIVLQISSYLVRQRRLPSDRIFTVMIIVTSAGCATETISFMVDGRTFQGAHTISVITCTLLYALNVTLSFLWCIYVDLRLYKQESRLKKYYKWLAVPTLILIASLIPNIRFGYLFSFDAGNVYSRQPLSYIYYLSVFVYIGFSVCVRYRYYKESPQSRFFPIWMFIMPLIVGTTAQLLFYGISLAWISAAVGLVGVHMALQNELSYIDPLTKLYNRNYLDHVLSEACHKGTKIGGVMIDIDFFKDINDMYGHSVGDRALINTANIIREAIPSKSIAVRFAGDEFVIISKADNEFELINIERSIRNQLKRFNNSGKADYHLSFSMGMSILGENDTADSFMNDMDEKMYSEKHHKHCRSAVSTA
ncbi:MAG: GGDEF domain-containing protein [Ruminococcus sp.]|uniref:GGDEF domain-containing protein n=1 Tax=Ruminococcus sp. TaxID=41978 RepID=UPI0025D727A2|nr:GGDEF domain-containing protein [Ruminococcus sp.]MCR5599591.1 GGDEF domain-containing protein [Ruminococcus sp.]